MFSDKSLNQEYLAMVKKEFHQNPIVTTSMPAYTRKHHGNRHIRNLNNLQNEFQEVYREHRVEIERLEQEKDQKVAEYKMQVEAEQMRNIKLQASQREQ